MHHFFLIYNSKNDLNNWRYYDVMMTSMWLHDNNAVMESSNNYNKSSKCYCQCTTMHKLTLQVIKFSVSDTSEWIFVGNFENNDVTPRQDFKKFCQHDQCEPISIWLKVREHQGWCKNGFHVMTNKLDPPTFVGITVF